MLHRTAGAVTAQIYCIGLLAPLPLRYAAGGLRPMRLGCLVERQRASTIGFAELLPEPAENAGTVLSYRCGRHGQLRCYFGNL